VIMWDMHNRTTKEQAKENKEKQNAASTDWTCDGSTR
jgi:hypothetical protein